MEMPPENDEIDSEDDETTTDPSGEADDYSNGENDDE
jgi:hypothetical protein